MQSEAQIKTRKHEVCVKDNAESVSFLCNVVEEEGKDAMERDNHVDSFKTMIDRYNITTLGSPNNECEEGSINANHSSDTKIDIFARLQKLQCNGRAVETSRNEEYNEMIINNFSWRYFWSGGSGIIFAVFNSCLIFCVWPQHHIFMFPNFWHEFTTTTVIGFIGLFSASLILNCEIWLNIRQIKTWKNFILLYFLSAWAWLLSNIGYYHVYSGVFKLKPPMPLNIHVCGIAMLIVVLSTFWLLIPENHRSTNHFWERYFYYVLGQFLRYCAILEYLGVAWLFVIIEEKYQWFIAILLPVIRDINGRMLTNVCHKSFRITNQDNSGDCRDNDNSAIQVTCVHEMGCRHAAFLSVAITLLATRNTAFLCLGFDFITSLIICVSTVLSTKKKEQNTSSVTNISLQILAVKEKVGIIVPISYSLCFMGAYFGPNSKIIGNVGNTSWHFRKVENLGPPLKILGILFLIRFVGIGLWTIILNAFSNVKYIDGYMYIQRKFWLIMAIHEAYALNEVIKPTI